MFQFADSAHQRRKRVPERRIVGDFPACRGAGVGSRLCDELVRIARADGATEMVVSATPSVNTVRLYLGRGFEPTAAPLVELFEAEPEDVHMRKVLEG